MLAHAIGNGKATYHTARILKKKNEYTRVCLREVSNKLVAHATLSRTCLFVKTPAHSKICEWALHVGDQHDLHACCRLL